MADARERTDHSPGLSSKVTRLLQRALNANRTVILALFVRAGAVISGFAVTYLIGNEMGAAATGQFALVSQTAVFFSVIALIGLGTSVVRHFAKAVAEKAPLALTSFLSVGGLGVSLLLLVALVFILGGDFVWKALFGDSVPREFLPLLCILLIARGGTRLLGAMLRSQHSFTVGQSIAVLSVPFSTAIALILGWAENVEEALWAGAIGAGIALAIGLIVMTRHLSANDHAVSIPMKAVLASSIPLWGVDLAAQIGEWYALAVAGRMLSPEDAGYYRVGVQLAAVLQVATMALFSVYTVQISSAFHANDRAKVGKLARTAVRMSTAITLSLAAALLFMAEFILVQIGPDFSAAYPVLSILVFGQIVITLTGPSGSILAMSGNEKANLALTVTSTALLLLIVPLGAISGGLYGIAAAASAVVACRNLASYYLVRRIVGIAIWSGADLHQKDIRTS